MTAAVMADQARHGRTTITSRAVRRVVSAVTAEALDVSASEVSVELDDDGGRLHVTAQAPSASRRWASRIGAPPGRCSPA
ncbi:hypothetical protein Q0F99_07265 [Rathayibacter oskolensis]|uniref:hypothetical protein n=1 Tax=Rathayibacter oskolensis TaxID=1891671 RepID=UPI00265E6812|nr:hypothetical protein [Rathayibacter oskolensis]WKK72712.1 hypothetical protein Q0F99_07265 [Rathayibacter oskolensis]